MSKFDFEDEIPDWQDTALRRNKKIQALVTARQSAANRIKEFEDTKKSCSDELLAIMTAASVDKVRVDNCAVSVVTTERNTLNEGMLKKALLEGGMNLSKIEKLWEQCSSKSQSSYIKVTERKS